MNSSSSSQGDATNTKQSFAINYHDYHSHQIHKQTLLRSILDAGASLLTCPEINLPQLLDRIATIEQLPGIPHIALYLKQDQHFYRLSRSPAQDTTLARPQYLLPDTLMTQIQPYQYRSEYTYLLPVAAIQDEIPALLASLEIGNTQLPFLQGTQKLLLIPLISQTAPLGFLALPYDPSLTDDIIDLLTLFAQQLASSLQHAQLQDDLRRAREERQALAQVGRALLTPEATQDLQTIYQIIYTQLKALMPIDFFSIERYDPQQGCIIRDFEIEQGKIQTDDQHTSLPQLFLQFLWDDQPRFLMFSSLNEFLHTLSTLMPELLNYVEEHLPLPSGNLPQSGIVIVLKYAGEPQGILSALSYQEHSYTQQHLHMLRAISRETALAIKSASMYSELRQALKAAQESEQLKNHFLMTASHELRTPLTAVQGYLELLDNFSDTLSEETKRQFLNNARRACEELILLLGNVMDASRIDQDKVEMKLRSVHLIDPIHTIVEIMDPIIIREARSVDVQVPDTLHVIADDLRLRQILLNLVGNALKYSPAPQGIAIRAEALTSDQLAERFPAAQSSSSITSDHHYVVIAIRDWGPGISPADQSRLFTKFMRLNRAINSTQRGAGLGLYLCRQLIEAMQGFIWMESSGIPGEGCTFFVALPQSMPTT